MDISNQLAGHWLAAAAVFLLAGTVKGVIGLGLPTVAMALLALWMPPAQAAALLIVPSLVTNLWQTGPRATFKPVLCRIGGMQAGIVAGTLGGALWLGVPGGAWASVALGVALVAYALWGLTGRQLHVPPGRERWLGPAVGAATGLVTAVTGVFAMPAVPYMQALGFQRDALIQAMGISFTTSTVVLAIGLAGNGGYPVSALGGSIAMLLPAIGGMALGTWLRKRLPVAVFRRCFLAGLALLGLYMVARALG
ncbi:sulfite exporter TauE/SafE family protein [Variovorax sp. DXTD-1]|uniref:sulfite exporter TauE/SafE family protein n=1 Tax=Variovorax sp. DXTD-1 TaxID=2495592 RepID=UPI000F87C716|nr:sulfite exporter TauE/SafE family protein [Variovorax sp. DXTD-1]RST53333.1 sulfite exporter TauE/SafE family protein [Variovorax sp. DXTD-1]